MTKTLNFFALFSVIIISGQIKTDSTKTKDIAEVIVIARKPTIENKRTELSLMYRTAPYLLETPLGMS